MRERDRTRSGGGKPTVATARNCFYLSARGAERELDKGPAPSSAREIETPIQQMIPEAPERRPSLFPWLSEPLQKLPPFFADTRPVSATGSAPSASEPFWAINMPGFTPPAPLRIPATFRS